MKLLIIFLCNLVFIISITAQRLPPNETEVDRLLRYVQIDTQSEYNSETIPSTIKQFDLANLLANELKRLGAENVFVSEFCIVYAIIPGNLKDNSKVPVLGLIAHMDTSPDVLGANVNPIVHNNFKGGDIVLPKDTTQVITLAKNPVLKEMIGDDIITADGTTLLGVDNKAGCAEIMTLVDILKQNPQIKHGTIAVAFASDEEVGFGIEKFNFNKFGAEVAYTVDGGPLGEINNETFNARTAVITFKGNQIHPAIAKGVMINSAFATADFISLIPKEMLPEATEGRIGYIYPIEATITTEESILTILLRDFELDGINEKENLLREMAKQTENKFTGVKINVDVIDEYLNMKEGLKDYPQLTEYAIEAIKQAGLKPNIVPVRGGTYGSVLTTKGLPCPNLFTGGHNFHSKHEFTSRLRMEKTTETLVNLVKIFANYDKE